MDRTPRWCLLLLAACSLAAAPAPSPDADATSAAQAAIQKWPKACKVTAAAMIEEYGQPDQFDRHALAWFNKGTWRRTVVSRKPRDGKSCLEQTIAYLVPKERVAKLKRFSPRLTVNPTAGELSFASASEATNHLALNLADEIVVGKRTVPEAREFFARTKRLGQSGKSSPYLDQLRFDVDNDRYMTPTGADR